MESGTKLFEHALLSSLSISQKEYEFLLRLWCFHGFLSKHEHRQSHGSSFFSPQAVAQALLPEHLRWDSLRYDQRPTFHQQGLGEEAREEVSTEEHRSLKSKLCLPRCQHNRWIWAPPKRPILHQHLLPECHWIRHLLEQGISAQDHLSLHLRDPLILLMLLVNLSLTCIQHWMESKNPSL